MREELGRYKTIYGTLCQRLEAELDRIDARRILETEQGINRVLHTMLDGQTEVRGRARGDLINPDWDGWRIRLRRFGVPFWTGWMAWAQRLGWVLFFHTNKSSGLPQLVYRPHACVRMPNWMIGLRPVQRGLWKAPRERQKLPISTMEFSLRPDWR